MHRGDDRGVRPFGRRRPPDGQAGPHAAAASPDRAAPARVAGPLPWALRMAGFVGLLAVIAALQLARLSQPDEGAVRLALDAPRAPVDPETTGAIAADAARAARLNPCLVPAADAVRP
ncbi:hypothetical protein [Methylobacterium sp. J-070]|uniref:hypothetical protein n=1 Tax=Methylobacterium sp. J-070 TaxID=2836650 RepID=UPI001FBBFA09|nr:hypothetical protein [Methylobacterium sp. J-070]MCJ2050927.1 hypothetical protein [Methylobacterium sp. J-070]